LDEIQQKSCYFSSILVGVGGGFAIGKVSTLCDLFFFKVYSNSNKQNILSDIKFKLTFLHKHERLFSPWVQGMVDVVKLLCAFFNDQFKNKNY